MASSTQVGRHLAPQQTGSNSITSVATRAVDELHNVTSRQEWMQAIEILKDIERGVVNGGEVRYDR
jgi:hypothetical protein